MLYAILAVLIDNEIIQRADAIALCAARIRAVALRIGIDQQNTFPVMCSHICQGAGRRGFADAAFLVGDCKYCHTGFSSQMMQFNYTI